MCTSVWFELFGGLLSNVKTCDILGGKCDNKDYDLKWEHMFSSLLRYKRRNNIKEVHITKVWDL